MFFFSTAIVYTCLAINALPSGTTDHHKIQADTEPRGPRKLVVALCPIPHMYLPRRGSYVSKLTAPNSVLKDSYTSANKGHPNDSQQRMGTVTGNLPADSPDILSLSQIGWLSAPSILQILFP